MDEKIETVCSPCYNAASSRRIRLLKLLRIALFLCLFMAWTYGIAVAAAFVQEGSGAATLWMLQFVMFTIPATVLLIVVLALLHRLSRSYQYLLCDDQLEIRDNRKGGSGKLLAQINCFSIHGFYSQSAAPFHQGSVIRATVSKQDCWALDVRHEGRIVRVWLQPDEALAQKLKSYVRKTVL